MTFEDNGLVWFQTIGLKETAVSDQSRFQANGGAVYNTPENHMGRPQNNLFLLHLCCLFQAKQKNLSFAIIQCEHLGWPEWFCASLGKD